MNTVKILTLLGASLMAFACFGLTYSAAIEDGVLRALAVGVMAGMIGFGSTIFVVWIFEGIGK